MQLGHSVLNQPSSKTSLGPAHNFAHIFSGERQICIVMKAKILNVMDEYRLSNPLFFRGGSNWPCSSEIQSQIT